MTIIIQVIITHRQYNASNNAIYDDKFPSYNILKHICTALEGRASFEKERESSTVDAGSTDLPLGHVFDASRLLLSDTPDEVQEAFRTRRYTIVGPLQKEHVLHKTSLARLRRTKQQYYY